MPSINISVSYADHHRNKRKREHLDISHDGTHHHLLPTHESSHFLDGLKLPNILVRWIPLKHSPPSDQEPLIPSSQPQSSSFASKYGSCTEILHYGTHSSVRVYTRKSSRDSKSRQLHIVKVFRPSSQPSITSHYRLEQHLSSSLSHPNICRATDALRNDRGELCLVMDYCAGGDLNSFIATSGKLETVEADCFFKQIIRAVSFLHENGIAHRELKTENILLSAHGAVKIADFGSAECLVHSSEQSAMTTYCLAPRKLFGTVSYIAPEELQGEKVEDPRAGDVWTAALVYMAMRWGRLLWGIASEEDTQFGEYLSGRQTEEGYPPIEALGRTSRRNVVYAMLHPVPHRRITASNVLRSEWVHGVVVCDAGELGL
ncbi:hypothetical protein ASPWEDRAFT_170389 [Aspergillus wentii DTO 134E9]|uniref:Protein kinase domain-containing protein n=1 Tax=Aspergillus wentii DTO 134E9 TaxID=1073089 RepID=A0A1L9RPM6_ASPWE|nr:uncharacterized protein ASPWEDRAFT_170389 [Aspergillus wentii DTO 134E9]KAI9924075.1 hypothetical protein MW887_007314 [Aspergillus wentii]OJJ36884.1 hypothetical protein ASPWEDRAFT_170389 [Aspergillus wentii DTO 134E9]